MDCIYFDHAATTPLEKRVLEAMMPYMTENFGNANSAHQMGRQSKVAIEDAREKIAKMLDAEPSEIIFTSGGTESDNAIIKGVVAATGKKEIVTSPVEHHAVLHPAEALENHGISVKYLEPDKEGLITPEQVENAISNDTALVSLMHINNEIGTINPIKEIADVCRDKNVTFHSDTVQSIGKVPISVKDTGVDALSVSAHKIYGPKGVGVLYLKNGTPWEPWLQGGSQERKRRGGTSNVPGIVGLSAAMELALEELEENSTHYRELRISAIQKLEEKFGDRFFLNGPRINAAPHVLNVAFLTPQGKGLDGEMLLLNLDIEGICVSNGSACTSGAMEPSHVLTGIGLSQERANSSIRISFGKQNTFEEIDIFVEKLENILDRMLAMAG